MGDFPLNGSGVCVGCQPGVLAMTPSGTIPYWPNSCGPNDMAGPFTSSLFFTNPTLQDALTTTAYSYTVSFEIYLESGSAYQVFFENNSGANIFAWDQTAQKFWWAWNSGSYFSTHTFSPSCHHVDLIFNGLGGEMFVDGVSEVFVPSIYYWPAGDFILGADSGGSWPVTSYIKDFVVTNNQIPAPTLTRTPCSVQAVTPFPSNPVFVPTMTWEGSNTDEMSVIYDAVSPHWKAAYMANGFVSSVIGSTESADGVHWTHNGQPIIGSGWGGESGTANGPDLVKVGSQYRVYYCSNSGPRKMAYSSDFVSWSIAGTDAIPTSSIPGMALWYDSAYFDGGTGTVFMLATGNCAIVPRYRECAFFSVDGGLTFKPLQLGPLQTMDVGNGGMYGGAHTILYFNGLYHTWYHAGYAGGDAPTTLWHAYSKDFINWIPDVAATLPIAGNEMGETNCNQLGNPSLIQAPGGVQMYFGATDNVAPRGVVGFASYSGTLADFADCVLVSVTYSPSIYLNRRLKLRQ